MAEGDKQLAAMPNLADAADDVDLVYIERSGNSRNATVAQLLASALRTFNNLSDLTNIVDARVNLGLGNIATYNLGDIISLITQGQKANGLLEGGAVAWESGLTFRVSHARYVINDTEYSSSEQTVTLTAAHATLDRIDVIALDTTGTVVKIDGTAAATPSQPDVNPNTQLFLTFVLVRAAQTAPQGITIEDIYHENTEWTTSTSGTGFNAASTVNPHAGTKDVEGTTVAANAYIQFQRSSSIDLTTYDLLRLFIRSKAAWASGRILRAQWYLNGVAKGAAVTIASGFWGFDSSNLAGYQFLGIPMSQFQLPAGTTINQLRITDVGGSIGFYIDDITIQDNGNDVGGGNQNTYLTLNQAITLFAPSLLTVDTVSGTSYTLAANDLWHHKRFTNAGAVTLTINANHGLPVGARVRFTQDGTGQVTMVGSGVTLNSADNALKSRARYSVWELECVSATVFDVLGDVG